MTGPFRVLAYALCIATVAANLWFVRDVVPLRVEADVALGRFPSPSRKRVELFNSNVEMMVDLERKIREGAEDGHEVVAVSISGRFSNVLVSVATHTSYPVQVIEQSMPKADKKERLKDARRRGATLLITLQPDGWKATHVERGLEKLAADSEGGN